MPIKDPIKRKLNHQKWYEANKKAVIARVKKNNKRTIQENVAFIKEIKSNTPCKDCGKFYPYYVMDFDHLKDKTMAISRMVYKNQGKPKLLEEISKCELVCANCHRERTYKRTDSSAGRASP